MDRSAGRIAGYLILKRQGLSAGLKPAAIDALELKSAYIAEAEGFWHRLTPDQLKTRLSGLRLQLWGEALSRLGINDVEIANRSAERPHLRNRDSS